MSVTVEEEKLCFVGIDREAMIRKPCKGFCQSRAEFVDSGGEHWARCIDCTVIHIECEVTISPFLSNVKEGSSEEGREGRGE